MATSLELKMRKIETLSTYLDKERKNLDYLRSNNRNDNNARDISKCEHTIKTVQQQLQMQCGEVNTNYNPNIAYNLTRQNLKPIETYCCAVQKRAVRS